jgi:hypothetical protein
LCLVFLAGLIVTLDALRRPSSPPSAQTSGQTVAESPKAPAAKTPGTKTPGVRLPAQTRVYEEPAPPPKTEPTPLPITPLPGETARLAIVIDDLGESLSLAKALANLPYPVAFAVWPQASHTHATARLALEHGLDLLLHHPMDPKGYPEVDPGPGAIFHTMTPDEVRATLVRNLDSIPGVQGVNNHMGSRFTEDAAGMKSVATELAARKLYFLDSYTSAESVAYHVARQAKVPSLRRDVFIDNVAERDAVLAMLAKAEAVARRKGQAVAIGHPHPGTIEALV